MELALRHALATVAYRAGNALRDAPPGFGDFRPFPGTRSPGEILAHMGDLIDWAESLARGKEEWREAAPLPWDEEVARFFAALQSFDRRLDSNASLAVSPEAVFQGPLADALTHIGQIALLRRIAGSAVRGENYHRADVVAGRVGLDQSPPRREFD